MADVLHISQRKNLRPVTTRLFVQSSGMRRAPEILGVMTERKPNNILHSTFPSPQKKASYHHMFSSSGRGKISRWKTRGEPFTNVNLSYWHEMSGPRPQPRLISGEGKVRFWKGGEGYKKLGGFPFGGKRDPKKKEKHWEEQRTKLPE